MKEIIVVLHNIRSIYNTASIFRTADGAGVKKIYLCGMTPAPTDQFGKIRPQFAKVSLGAERYIKWEKINTTWRLLKKLENDGYKIFAVEQDGKSIPYYRAASPREYPGHSDEIPAFGARFAVATSRREARLRRRTFRIALVFGNEVSGLPPSVLKLADKILEIPMRGKFERQTGHPKSSGEGKESLNVSVAAGIVLYHFAA